MSAPYNIQSVKAPELFENPPHQAKLHGEPFLEMPSDLFIPPEALSVFLEAFEGPLDLLLYLIRKHSLDILDIPMADLTRQYMAYVQTMRANQFELAAEYLLMAALLIEIKSRMLLPRPPREDEAEALDPRAELVRRLLEYEQMKAAAAELDRIPQAGRDFAIVEVMLEQNLTQRLPDVNANDLTQAWLTILNRARMNKHHRITREELSVRAHMSRVLRMLTGGNFVEFSQMFDPSRGAPVVVVTFLALLELARESLIELTQAAPFDPIYAKSKNVLSN
ncbi:MAG: ScpA family protein [Burkholderiales bacterium]